MERWIQWTRRSEWEGEGEEKGDGDIVWERRGESEHRMEGERGERY